MAAELRLILLGIGVALIVVLWWWERRRGATGTEGPPRDPQAFEPRIELEPRVALPAAAAPAAPEPVELDTQELPARRAPVLEHPVPRGDPPVITIDGLPDETVEVVLEEPAAAVAASPPLRAASAPRGGGERGAVTDPPVVELIAEAKARAEPAAEPAPEPASDQAAGETPPRHQRIVAVRLLGRDNQRIDGKLLKAALGSEGLEFGRYAIYHRNVDGGRPLYSVASLVEPGSFDPNVMDSLRYPGISMFAVFPGPLPAPQCFDELLATARRLADRLGATLQDDSGSSLTGQRVLSIREDLVHFEHLVSLSRSRPRG